ncbi:hypothetical protein ACFZBM_17050 [Streptomyces lavendulae]|uniref:Peptidoglycan-binding protein n=1 Tax=Streptomyces lavendulae subsp. lavendulae TaxID=58340 RepID=A0A2K8P7V9_STRLA|nr:hypothetical protein [Streptomyces lavendulae]ATZ22220.1 hypothetical protein SLAV_01455 [Streptomyces lavendulae subsp. lavendulae]GLW04140.1 hypothetical protein Slala05_77700 [Streptomyces lavendulae subsp. lavendulae]
MKTRSVVTALLLVLGALFVPGFGALAGTTQAHAATKISHATATSMFRQAGIAWSSSGNCSDRNNPTCTSFDQLNLATAQGAQTLKSATGCALTITGGTETGHASGTYSHWNGYKLDYAKASCLTSYVKNTFSYIGLRGDGAPMWQSGSGNVYADEGNHWDVLYYNCGGC